MAKTKETPARTEPVDLGGQDALGFAAAWQGLYHLFGARVESWDVNSDGLVAHGVTVDSKYDLDQIVRDINTKDRRPQLFPAVLSIVNPDIEPPHFESNLDITTYMVNFWKGSMGENSTKVPEYVRNAASEYKERMGTKTRRGPKPKSLNLRNVRELNVDTIKNADLSADDIDYLIQIATAAREAQGANSAAEAATAES